MQLDGAGESGNVEDRRGLSPGVMVGGGGSILLVVLALVFGIDPKQIPGAGGGGGAPAAGQAPGKNDREKHLIGAVLKFTEDVWTKEFAKNRAEYRADYRKPHLVIFSNQVRTGCGNAPSSVGPFYCPADETVYIDPTFFDELQNRLGGSKADFSQAYVIAHEIGHHVQKILGYSDKTDRLRGTPQEHHASVRLELQADYLAGVWANHGQEQFHFIENGDVDSAIQSANSIGDDRLQKKAQGWSSPEKYTHGTSAQRVKFFTEGYKTGDDSRRRLDRFYTADFNSRGELED